MNKIDKVMLLRYCSGGLLIVLMFVLQSNLLQFMNIRGIMPNLLVITTVAVALLRGRIEGALCGAVIGLLIDIFFGSVIGFYGAIYMYIGFGTGFLHGNFYKDSVLIPLGLIAAADVVVNIITYFFTFLFRGQLAFHLYVGQIIIPELIYTLLIGFLLYRLLYLINYKIELVEWAKEYED